MRHVCPSRVLFLPYERAEGPEGLEAEPLIKPQCSVIEVCHSEGHLLIAQSMGLAKGEIEKCGSKSQGLEVRANGHLGDVSGGPMDAGKCHKASEFSRTCAMRHQTCMRQRLAASSQVKDVVNKPRGPRSACVLVIDDSIDVAAIGVSN